MQVNLIALVQMINQSNKQINKLKKLTNFLLFNLNNLLKLFKNYILNPLFLIKQPKLHLVANIPRLRLMAVIYVVIVVERYFAQRINFSPAVVGQALMLKSKVLSSKFLMPMRDEPKLFVVIVWGILDMFFMVSNIPR